MGRLPKFNYRSPFFYMVTLKKRKGLPVFSRITAKSPERILCGAPDVTITFDPVTREILVEGDGVIPPANQIEYITAVGVSNGNFLNGSDWDPLYTPNRMEETENGVYEITFCDVETNNNYEFKFAANGDWDINWGGESGNYAATDVYHPAYFNSSYNIEFYIDDDEDYADVTLVLDIRNWDPVSKEGATYDEYDESLHFWHDNAAMSLDYGAKLFNSGKQLTTSKYIEHS